MYTCADRDVDTTAVSVADTTADTVADTNGVPPADQMYIKLPISPTVGEEYQVLKRGMISRLSCVEKYNEEKDKNHLPCNIKAIWKEFQEGKRD